MIEISITVQTVEDSVTPASGKLQHVDHESLNVSLMKEQFMEGEVCTCNLLTPVLCTQIISGSWRDSFQGISSVSLPGLSATTFRFAKQHNHV